jgi:threonine dehydratase
MKKITPTFVEIEKAHQLIKNYIHRTPVLTSKTLNKITGSQLFFKCENFQKAGAFKFRGATNAVFALSEEEAKRGVLTHSSGNHAGALSLAASMRNIPAYIVMPRNAPQVKKDAVQTYGGIITECEPTLAARETTADKVQKETGATLIHPYNNEVIIAGQGTATVELLEETGNLDAILTPVGGGGLLSGTAIAAKSLDQNISVYGCEPQNADDAFRSFHAGKIIPVENPNTIADGLRTSLGVKTFPIIKKLVNDILLVSEEDIVKAMRMIWERMKIIVEPSAVVPLAAVLGHQEELSGKRIGLILSGGNVDVRNLPF